MPTPADLLVATIFTQPAEGSITPPPVVSNFVRNATGDFVRNAAGDRILGSG